ncbi:Oidioi.mRNA.OKI2018_I69.chr2.g5724.t1.cds [Oikopleura dioica]|uniref:Oidioi.mRNA.OKI2018_I69.chr2.g5724.t1.cds n=1 Tax=Oikopleura dioica TaxID=34765 RepID=A0ABN7T5H5_OIKDI|nr:Oidioi.mRNA.OKI2018_I69.chr2.g5724.t1.cds [Oikopleura dioica]
MDPNQPRQNLPQNAPKTNYIQIRPIAPAQGQNRPIQPGQIQFHVPTKSPRTIRPAKAKTRVVIPSQQVVNVSGQQVIQAPQNQRVVFLQPVTNSNGQITYIQKNAPSQQSPTLIQSARPQQVQSVKLESTMSDEFRGRNEGTSSSFNLAPASHPYVLPSPMPVSATVTEHMITENLLNRSNPNATVSGNNKGCSCSKSKCLKLYCECFRRGEYCHSYCACTMCHNQEQYNDLRQKAIKSALDRNEDAFKPKVAKSGKQVNNKGKHLRGCNCKRSGCLKKYCECYQAGVPCNDICNCVGCKNRDDHDIFNDLGPPGAKRQKLGVSRILQTTLSPAVVSAAANCLIASARSKPDDPVAAERAVLAQFGRTLKDIISHTINQQRESSRKTLNS